MNDAPHPEVTAAFEKLISRSKPGEGHKADLGKLPMELVPVDVLQGVASVLRFGAKKYGERNWEKGMAWSRVYGALLRHLFDFWNGERFDAETGELTIDHVVCCAMFLAAFERRQIGTDDRPPTLPK